MRLLAPLLAIWLLFLPSMAQAAEPLFIGQTKVDVMGASAEDARELAIVKAKREALDDLLEKFIPSQRKSIIDQLTDEQITEMTRQVKFENELIDGNRFRADALVSFSATMFNKAIADKVKAVESDQELQTTSSLILPVFETGDRMFLFETVNPWGVAWQEVARNIGRGKLITPYGDSVDYSMISGKDALKATFKEFIPLARRYGVRDVVVLHATLGQSEMVKGAEDEKPTQVLKISERRVQFGQDELKTLEYVADAEETSEQLMERAARDIGVYIMAMQADTVTQIGMRNKQLSVSMGVIRISTMQRFYELRDKLKTVSGIEVVEVLAIKPRQADIRLQFTGERSALIESLLASGLKATDHTHYLEIYQ